MPRVSTRSRSALQAAPYLNGLVHQLPWHQEVERALRRQLN